MSTPDDQLWNDAFDEGIDPALAVAVRERTIRYLRRRRQKRRVGLGMACGLAGILLYATVRLPVLARVPLPHRSFVQSVPDAREIATLTQPPASAPDLPIHFLTDEELLSRFPNRPVALIGSPKHRQEFVFLDDPRSVRAAELAFDHSARR